MSDNQTEGLPAQHQSRQPGSEQEMQPRPHSAPAGTPGQRLAGKVALITGGDSGIGRAVALAYAREGARVAIVYLDEEEDARQTQKDVQALDAPCLLLPGDVGSPEFCRSAVRAVMDAYGRLDVLVNNRPSSIRPRASNRFRSNSWSTPSAPTSSRCSTWSRKPCPSSRAAHASSTPPR
ncbi:hypothetical protein HBDW_38350 [Herbaspirillum sp. DW155]|nr:hypothetical protein HBDW_38350 [Herbaspirillum sp. DW155]